VRLQSYPSAFYGPAYREHSPYLVSSFDLHDDEKANANSVSLSVLHGGVQDCRNGIPVDACTWHVVHAVWLSACFDRRSDVRQIHSGWAPEWIKILLSKDADTLSVLTMEYKQFVVCAFEREPGKWRASVERADGKAIMAMTNRRTLAKFVTGVDVKSAQVAILMAMAAIDAGAFSKASNSRRW
jgi:hypothetical protein